MAPNHITLRLMGGWYLLHLFDGKRRRREARHCRPAASPAA